MGSEGEGGKPERHVYGARSIGVLVSRVARPAFQSRSAAVAQLMADWPAIVGPRLAATTMPQRLTSGTLTLACSGPVALELQHLAGELAARINGHFGRVVVERFRFVQGSAGGSGPAPVRRRARAAPIEIADLEAGELRDALARLGAAVAAESGGSGRR